MLWVVVLIGVVLAACGSVWCGLALAEAVYGYPVYRGLMQTTIWRRDEHRFLAGDVHELDETFRRVISSFSSDSA